MSDQKARGYFQYTLAIDCETSGLAMGCDDPSYNPDTKEEYQAVSWGMIVVDTATLKPVDQLYVEIEFDKRKYTWNKQAERIHGMSQQYLRVNGMSMEDAVIEIGNMILKYWGTESPISLLGHNVATFDLQFLRRTLRSQGIEVRFANRHVDTNSIGFAAFETYNSDDLFELIGLPVRDPGDRNPHNALADANYALKVVQSVRGIYNHIIGEG